MKERWAKESTFPSKSTVKTPLGTGVAFFKKAIVYREKSESEIITNYLKHRDALTEKLVNEIGKESAVRRAIKGFINK